MTGGLSTRRFGTACLAATWVGALACEGPLHPNNPAVPDLLCEPRCQREHECDAAIDTAACVTHCEQHLSPRAVYRRDDYVASLRACALAQTCVGDVDAAISACQSDVLNRLEPGQAVRSFCSKMVARSFKCGDYRWDEAHCLWGHKGYSEAIVSQLDDCLDRRCNNYARCMHAVVGDDPVGDDSDRFTEFRRQAIRAAPPASVNVRGKVSTEAEVPIPGATVCVRVLRDQRCVHTSEAGGFALAAPAHGEIAVSATAAGFGARLVALTTRGRDVADWRITLLAESVVRARSAALTDAGGEAEGSIFATAEPPPGSPPGIEGVTMAIAPATGARPLFFSSTGDPDPARTATSTWSRALFAGIAPGEVTLTLGPQPLTCTPLHGGWPSPAPNSVRVPVLAGFETQVALSCHR